MGYGRQELHANDQKHCRVTRRRFDVALVTAALTASESGARQRGNAVRDTDDDAAREEITR